MRFLLCVILFAGCASTPVKPTAPTLTQEQAKPLPPLEKPSTLPPPKASIGEDAELDDVQLAHVAQWLLVLREFVGEKLEDATQDCKELHGTFKLLKTSESGALYYSCGSEDEDLGFIVAFDRAGEIFYVSDSTLPYSLSMMERLLGEGKENKKAGVALEATVHEWRFSDAQDYLTVSLINSEKEGVQFLVLRTLHPVLEKGTPL